MLGDADATFNFDPGFFSGWVATLLQQAGTAATLLNLGTFLAGNDASTFGSEMALSSGVTLANEGTINGSGSAALYFHTSSLINEVGGLYEFQSDGIARLQPHWNQGRFGNRPGQVVHDRPQ